MPRNFLYSLKAQEKGLNPEILHVLTAAQSEPAECLWVSTIDIQCQPIIFSRHGF